MSQICFSPVEKVPNEGTGVTLWVWISGFIHFLSSFTLQIRSKIKDTHVLLFSLLLLCALRPVALHFCWFHLKR